MPRRSLAAQRRSIYPPDAVAETRSKFNLRGTSSDGGSLAANYFHQRYRSNVARASSLGGDRVCRQGTALCRNGCEATAGLSKRRGGYKPPFLVNGPRITRSIA
jgi:hypothetical protein